MIRTLVIDDEPLALDLVRSYVDQTPFLELVGSCSNAKDAYARIAQGDVELIFLDVQMPGMSGLTLMKAIESYDNAPKAIFTTAFAEYALEGFKLNAVDYLLKPFNFDEFMKAATKAQRLIELEQNSIQPSQNATDGEEYFFVKSEHRLVRIDVPRIIYIEGLKDYIKVYMNDEPKPVLTLSSLKNMEARLPQQQFLRVHRSFIINIAFVHSVDKNQILMSNNAKIPMGEGFKQQFTEVINKKIL